MSERSERIIQYSAMSERGERIIQYRAISASCAPGAKRGRA